MAAPGTRRAAADNATLSLPIFDTVINGKTVIGLIVGTGNDLADVFALHAAGLHHGDRRHRKIDEVNQSIDDVRPAPSRPVSLPVLITRAGSRPQRRPPRLGITMQGQPATVIMPPGRGATITPALAVRVSGFAARGVDAGRSRRPLPEPAWSAAGTGHARPALPTVSRLAAEE